MTTKNDARRIQDKASETIKTISVLMENTAKAARLSVDSSNVFAAMWPGVIAAFLPVTDQERSTIGLLFVSFPTFACAKSLPTGFYVIEPTTINGDAYVEYRDLKGRSVLVKQLFRDNDPETAGTGLNLRQVAVNAIIIQWWKGTPTEGTDHGQIVIGEPT